ncbi:hypothetical protein GEMRC1_005358 [Eukaryota sp. GEM-RC1]
MKFLFLVFLLLVLGLATPEPGLKSTLSKKGVDHVTSVAVSLLRKKLNVILLPNQIGVASSPIGHIQYELSEILLFNPFFGPVVVTNVGGIRLDITAVSFHVHMKWSYKCHHVKDHGTAEIDILGAHISISAVIAPSPSGGIIATLHSPIVDLGKLNIQVSGGAKWLYNLFIDTFSHDIKKSVASAIESTMVKTFEGLIKKTLSDFTPILNIDEYADLDMRFKKDCPRFNWVYLKSFQW